jgi:hypothetical protein
MATSSALILAFLDSTSKLANNVSVLALASYNKTSSALRSISMAAIVMAASLILSTPIVNDFS